MDKELEKLMNMIEADEDTPSDADIDDMGFDADEAAEAALFGFDSEEEKPVSGNRRKPYNKRKEDDNSGPAAMAPPEDFVVQMHQRAKAGNAKLLTGDNSRPCGCFTCQRIYSERKVKIQRRTLVCPYCGKKTVIPSGGHWNVGSGMLWRLWAYYVAFGERDDPPEVLEKLKKEAANT